MSYTKAEQKKLLKIARDTISHYFLNREKLEIEPKKVGRKLSEKKASFVTLTLEGKLKGCIGNILPKLPLYKDVVNNSLSAAFADSRFPNLEEKEFKEVKIEISILTKPKRIIYESIENLLEKIKAFEHGIILQSSFHQATFLPQVWEDLPDKKDFLTNLALKAGLSGSAWQDPEIEYFYYTVEHFSE
jgi:uncharacterized protein